MKSAIKCVGVISLLLSCGFAWAGVSDADSTVLMKYQGVIVTRADFDAEVRRIPEENRLEVLASQSRIAQILDNLLLNSVFSSEARKIGLHKDPAFINELRLAEDRLLARDYMNDRMKKLSLPDFEARAKEFYKVNPEKYTLKPMVNASHILVTIKDGKKEEALKQANDFYNQLLSGANFDEMATRQSDDKSAKKNGGRLGWFSADQMVKEFSDAAFALEKAGDISKPVESRFGYHLIKLQDKKQGGLRDYAEVRNGIIEMLKAEYLASAKKDIIGSVRGSSDLQINEAEVSKLKTKLPFVSDTNDGAAGGAK